MTLLRIIAVAVLLLVGCREGDSPTGARTGGARVYITSDPNGARIIVDGEDTRQRTPDTVAGFVGSHTVQVRLDTLGVGYEYVARITLSATDSVVRHMHGPLATQCGVPPEVTTCYQELHGYRTGGGIRFATNPLGGIFFVNGSGQGALWPAASSNSYVSSGIPVFAALVGSAQLALGVYDHDYLAGRPAPVSSAAAGRATLSQSTWIYPPSLLHLQRATVRGMEIREEIVTDETVNGVVVIKLTFRNITRTLSYRQVDDLIPAEGLTFTDAYIGLALDPDIGDADDDWLSYDPALDMAFAYDARFAESSFGAGAAMAPALVGLRVVRAPAGTIVMLNGWENQNDWIAGTPTEPFGFGMLSGRSPYSPVHPHPRIGHLPGTEGDMRIAVTAGPVTLAPGEEAEIVIAVAFAAPAAGTYQSGVQVAPGDPLDENRALYRIAAQLRDRMRAAEALGR